MGQSQSTEGGSPQRRSVRRRNSFASGEEESQKVHRRQSLEHTSNGDNDVDVSQKPRRSKRRSRFLSLRKSSKSTNSLDDLVAHAQVVEKEKREPRSKEAPAKTSSSSKAERKTLSLQQTAKKPPPPQQAPSPSKQPSEQLEKKDASNPLTFSPEKPSNQTPQQQQPLQQSIGQLPLVQESEPLYAQAADSGSFTLSLKEFPLTSLQDDEPPSLVSMDDPLMQSNISNMYSSGEVDLTSSGEVDLSEDDNDEAAETTGQPVSPHQRRTNQYVNNSFTPSPPTRRRTTGNQNMVMLPAAPISPSHRARSHRGPISLIGNPNPASPHPNSSPSRRTATSNNNNNNNNNNNGSLRDLFRLNNERIAATSGNNESSVAGSAESESTATANNQSRSMLSTDGLEEADPPPMTEQRLPPPPPPVTPVTSHRSTVPLSPPPLESPRTNFARDEQSFYNNRRASIESTISSEYDGMDDADVAAARHQTEFFPRPSRNHEWMGRSVESLVLGHLSPAPVLALEDGADDDTAYSDYMAFRRRSTASTFGGRADYAHHHHRRRSSQGSFPGGRRGSLSLSGNVHGGTLANYYSHRRRQQQQLQQPADLVDRSYNERMGRRGSATTTGPMFRRRSSMATTGSVSERSGGLEGMDNLNDPSSSSSSKTGPNVLLSIMARESTGKTSFACGTPATQALRAVGGTALFGVLDQPAAGMATEVAYLAAAIDAGDWTETHQIISRLAPRLTGDPAFLGQDNAGRGIQDANLPPTAHKFHAGGGRLGLERDAFALAGGVQVMIRIFREKSFVGQEMSNSYDARDLSEEIVANRLAVCWNEALVSLRELVFALPSLVEDRIILDNGDFLPFLFTLLSHDSVFEAAAALIEEILSLLSQAPQQASQQDSDGVADSAFRATGRVIPASTFYLGNVADVYQLWRGFSCRQLAHFCRILALLVFEPEDRQLLESPAVLKSIELLQLRRTRAVRAGRDSTVDMNQAILLGDEELVGRLLQLLVVMNYAPSIRRFSPYHIIAHNPFIVDTLLMLGFSELENWGEINRQNNLAREMLQQEDDSDDGQRSSKPIVSRLGRIADWLEELSETLNEEREPASQILRIMTAAQQAGLVVGTRRQRSARFGGSNNSNRPVAPLQGEPSGEPGVEVEGAAEGGVPLAADGASMQGLASFAGMLTDQFLVRRLYQNAGGEGGGDIPDFMAGFGRGDGRQPRHPIQTSSDAANNLQFNAMLLGPYSVEVLFVLCTLLGGKRKLDAQEQVQRLGLIPILEEMFERLPWYKKGSGNAGGNEAAEANQREQADGQQPNGIHGEGCQCTPESALCVQYLRLLHNFCDRDCDNYGGRRLLLSKEERLLVFGRGINGASTLVDSEQGLLSKIIGAFTDESDESPYRFWLASCIESYLRGSSAAEQLFVAKSGLLEHLINDVSSERLHCAGSLQTSFDLLGELGKGNAEVFRLLVSGLDEESFRKLMGVAATNLVDSNVFIRSLLLSLERLSGANRLMPLYLSSDTEDASTFNDWSSTEPESRSYLTHSWWDAQPIALEEDDNEEEDEGEGNGEEDDPENAGTQQQFEDVQQSDWFPSLDVVRHNGFGGYRMHVNPAGLDESVGHYGWLFTPAGEAFSPATHLPNSIERLCWFLAANQSRLLRDLLGVVDLRNINHENICCLNTAVVIAIFAHRRQQLSSLLQELQQMNDDERAESNRRTYGATEQEVADRRLLQTNRYLEMDQQHGRFARSAPTFRSGDDSGNSNEQEIGDRSDILRNFREVLWFWREYYTHRGRDRLSLEFSSHLRFQEWDHVVGSLTADDGSPLALVAGPIRLPRSPFQRSARVAENPLRGL